MIVTGRFRRRHFAEEGGASSDTGKLVILGKLTMIRMETVRTVETLDVRKH
jgi:hypothetical protein